MDKKLFVLNLVYAFADLLFAALTVLVITWAAVHFDKLWIMLFLLFPVVLYNSHSVVIDSDIRQAKVDQLKPNRSGGSDGET